MSARGHGRVGSKYAPEVATYSTKESRRRERLDSGKGRRRNRGVIDISGSPQSTKNFVVIDLGLRDFETDHKLALWQSLPEGGNPDYGEWSGDRAVDAARWAFRFHYADNTYWDDLEADPSRTMTWANLLNKTAYVAVYDPTARIGRIYKAWLVHVDHVDGIQLYQQEEQHGADRYEDPGFHVKITNPHVVLTVPNLTGLHEFLMVEQIRSIRLQHRRRADQEYAQAVAYRNRHEVAPLSDDEDDAGQLEEEEGDDDYRPATQASQRRRLALATQQQQRDYDGDDMVALSSEDEEEERERRYRRGGGGGRGSNHHRSTHKTTTTTSRRSTPRQSQLQAQPISSSISSRFYNTQAMESNSSRRASPSSSQRMSFGLHDLRLD